MERFDMLGELVDRMQDAIAAASPWTRWVDIAGLGQLIIRPGVPVRWMVNAGRLRERHDLEGVLRSISA